MEISVYEWKKEGKRERDEKTRWDATRGEGIRERDEKT